MARRGRQSATRHPKFRKSRFAAHADKGAAAPQRLPDLEVTVCTADGRWHTINLNGLSVDETLTKPRSVSKAYFRPPAAHLLPPGYTHIVRRRVHGEVIWNIENAGKRRVRVVAPAVQPQVAYI